MQQPNDESLKKGHAGFRQHGSSLSDFSSFLLGRITFSSKCWTVTVQITNCFLRTWRFSHPCWLKSCGVKFFVGFVLRGIYTCVHLALFITRVPGFMSLFLLCLLTVMWTDINERKNYFHVSSVEELATCTAPSGCSEGRLTRLISVIHSVSGLTGKMLLWSQISDINVIIQSYNKEIYLHLPWQKLVFACRRITGPCIFYPLMSHFFLTHLFTCVDSP